jgi:PIN domain nuclease of toxin-antitoxin system
VDFLADAHAFLWQLYWPRRLGAAARRAFRATEEGNSRIHLPAHVLAECLMVVQKGRLPGATLADLLPHLEALSHSRNYSLLSLQPSTVLASHRYAAIPDIFDRLTVTEGALRGLPVITRDPVIRDSGLVPTLWD